VRCVFVFRHFYKSISLSQGCQPFWEKKFLALQIHHFKGFPLSSPGDVDHYICSIFVEVPPGRLESSN
ncbi:MAG: hypothetical protein ACRCU2_11315, partial [Planktothrix sp.]